MKNVIKLFSRNSKRSKADDSTIQNIDNWQSTEFDEMTDYVKIQHRCPPKEFVDCRLRIASALAYALNQLTLLGISKPEVLLEGKAKGQLICDKIEILDAGSRDGWTIEALKSLGYPNSIGVELLEDYVEYAKSQGRNVIQGDLHNLPFEDGAFDFTFSRHTLEHCLDPINVINELARVTKTGGAVYISFPLEGHTYGKHTLAIPNLESASSILAKCSFEHSAIAIKHASDTPVIPEGNEAILFFKKNS